MGVDGQKEYAGADGGAKQADHPVGIMTAPTGSAGNGWLGSRQLLDDIYR